MSKGLKFLSERLSQRSGFVTKYSVGCVVYFLALFFSLYANYMLYNLLKIKLK